MAKILIAYATTEGQSAKIAAHIAQSMGQHGHDCVVMDVENVQSIAPYDAVVVGGSLHASTYQPRLLEFVKHEHEALSQRPCAFFTVCLAAAGRDAKALAHVQHLMDEFERETGFEPHDETILAGALKYRSYGFVKRFMMKVIAKQAGGDTDTTKDFEYTNWKAVDDFASHFAGHVDDVMRPKSP